MTPLQRFRNWLTPPVTCQHYWIYTLDSKGKVILICKHCRREI